MQKENTSARNQITEEIEGVEGEMKVILNASRTPIEEVIQSVNKIRKEYKGIYTLSFEITL